ncbi:hypothetical protein HK20_06080 [Acetobacter sp. DsW_54]|nr:hypothetical protein HK20_06080 [Acetobacter sp. DsW_54]
MLICVYELLTSTDLQPYYPTLAAWDSMNVLPWITVRNWWTASHPFRMAADEEAASHLLHTSRL